ncbi:Stress-induced-phosphoprotein 1, partial [Nowakowskiella sp. JEL0078]
MTETANLLTEAQHSVVKLEWEKAIESFSQVLTILESDKKTNTSILASSICTILLSRSTCYLQLKKFDSALDDVLNLIENQPNVLLPFNDVSSISSHVAAVSRIVEIYTATDNLPMKAKYNKLLGDLKKKHAESLEMSVMSKSKGNAAFKLGEYSTALEHYRSSMQIDPSNSSVLANLAQTCLMLALKSPADRRAELLDEALQFAEKCTVINPKWGKSWYRKGCVLLRLGRLMDACAAFQQGLVVDGENPDMRKKYLESSKLAQSAASDGQKRMIGMMGEMKFRSWYQKNKSIVWTTSQVWERIIKNTSSTEKTLHLGNNLNRKITRYIQAAYPDTSHFECGPAEFDKKPWESVKLKFMAAHSLLTEDNVVVIFSTEFLAEHKPWSIVFTLSLDPESILIHAKKDIKLKESMYILELYPYIQEHRTYGFLVSRKSGIVIDMFGNWCGLVSKHRVEDAIIMDTIVSDSLSKNFQIESEMPMPGSIPNVFYTCDETSRFTEFAETFYEAERSHQTPKRKVENSEPFIGLYGDIDKSIQETGPPEEGLIDEFEENSIVSDVQNSKKSKKEEWGTLKEVVVVLLLILLFVIYGVAIGVIEYNYQ